MAAPTTYEGQNTTHLTVADKWGNVVDYTLTIEQTGGSAIAVPGRGFLLNNELTDFSFVPAEPGRTRPEPAGSRQAPALVDLADHRARRHQQPVVALGSPGGATIITTVLQTLTEHLDRGLPLVDAIAAPRASQRNAATTELEPALWNSAERGRTRSDRPPVHPEPGDRRGDRCAAAAGRPLARRRGTGPPGRRLGAGGAAGRVSMAGPAGGCGQARGRTA